jgi:hypothetical protein
MTETSDPLRLLEDPNELSEDERRLLVAGQNMTPPAALSASLWLGLSSKLPATTANAPSGPGGPGGPGGELGVSGGAAAAHGSGLGLLLIKAALALGAVGALVLGGRAWWRAHHAGDTPQKALPALSVPADRPAPAVSGALPLTAVDAAAPAPSSQPSAPAHAPSAARALKASERTPATAASSDAREESRVVTAARDALRSGDSAGALSLLAQARQRFGSGVLGQEREALLIEALSKSGQAAAARTHGQAFLKNYANSPYAARVRQIVGPE